MTAVGKPAVHQVLATLGYGDAIGHEVLGIQRVLRAAGYDSEIFVETADPRLEHLTVDYRVLPAASHPDNILIHHFSIGSRASRIAYALPDRMVLVYHNITPPEYFVDVHPLLVQHCFLGRRELGFYATRCDLGLGDSEYNRLELEALGFPTTGVLPVVPDFSHLTVRPTTCRRAPLTMTGSTCCLSAARFPNKRSKTSSAGSTPTSAGSIRGRGCCLSARTVDSSVISRCCISSSHVSAPSDVHLARSRDATRSSSRITRSPMCSSVQASTKDSVCRSSKRFTWVCP